MIDVVKATKYEAQDFGTEIRQQNKDIEVSGNNIDVANDNMVDVDNRMKKLLKVSNHCYLWMVIIAEIGVLVLLFIL